MNSTRIYHNIPLSIGGVFFIFGFLWILISDFMVVRIYADSGSIARMQMYKGWFFILISTIFVVLIVGKYHSRLQETVRNFSRLTRLYSVLSHINQTIIRMPQRESLFDNACRIAVEFGICKMAWIGLTDEASRDILPVSSCGAENGFLKSLRISPECRNSGIPALAAAVYDGKTFVCNSIANAPQEEPWHAEALKQGFRAFAVFPLHLRDSVIGAFAVYSGEHGFESEREVELLKELAEDISYAVGMHRFREEHADTREALYIVEERFRDFSNLLPQTVFEADVDGKISFLNKYALDHFGFTSDDLKNGILISDLFLAEERSRISREFKQVISGNEISGRELTARRKNGGTFPVVLYSNPIIRRETVFGFRGILVDITELKDMERMIIHSEKLAAIGTLTAGIAHEINNPIGYVDGNLMTIRKYLDDIQDYYRFTRNLIKNGTDRPDSDIKTVHELFSRFISRKDYDYVISDLKAAVGESVEGVEKVRKIVRDLQDFSRMENSVMKYDKVNLGIEKALAIAWNEIKYKAEVELELGEIPDVYCDLQRLGQVFLNLIVNAAHAIENRGKIRIKTYSENNSVVIRFEDTGRGIPQEIIGKIFDAFFTTKESGLGTGLGLSISRKIIKEHDGAIDVESEPGKGAVFTIRLPIHGRKGNRPQRILIVDDEEAVLYVLGEMLKNVSPGIEIRTAKDGFHAAENMRSFQPELVLLDIFMPGLDGLEVCRRIASGGLNAPANVIIMTGGMDEELKQKAFKAGAIDYWEKPIRIDVVKKLFDRYA